MITVIEPAKPLSESIRNKLQKERNKQDGVYKAFLKSEEESKTN